MKILISGGTGLVGKRLSKMLLNKGHDVKILSRKKSNAQNFVRWDIDQNYIDPKALEGIDAIIHLAGEGIADKLWTAKRKIEIIESRVKSTKLLYNALSNSTSHNVKTFISSSAIGYYSERGDELLKEHDAAAKDFLGTTCLAWENEVDRIGNLGIRTVKLRTGIVLSLEGGALKQMITPFKFNIGSALGNGQQWMSWIHINDLCEMYLYALENSNLEGAYNAAAPEPVRNTEFSKTLAKVLQKAYWAPNVPAFVLKLIFGEMSSVVLGSTRVSADKILNTGFKFNFNNLEKALINLTK